MADVHPRPTRQAAFEPLALTWLLLPIHVALMLAIVTYGSSRTVGDVLTSEEILARITSRHKAA